MKTQKTLVKKTLKTTNKRKPKMGGQGDGPHLGPEAGPSITPATSGPDKRSEEDPDLNKKDGLGYAHGVLWTLYDYEKHLDALREYARTQCVYMVFGYEIAPTTGRPHLQGYHYWKNERSMGRFSMMFGECKVIKADGTAKHNREYCLKIRPGDTPNTKWEEYGEMPQQGKRTDWERAVTDLATQDVLDVIRAQPQLAPSQRALREIKSMYLKPLHRDVTVTVLYGEAGSGKSRWAYDHYPDLYKKPVGDWWDGYSGQKAILLDDFYGWIKYHDLLHVLDRYPLNCPVKGGFIQAQWDTVVITSNDPPNAWYREKGLTPALRRRLKKVFYVTVIDGATNYQEETRWTQEAYSALPPCDEANPSENSTV